MINTNTSNCHWIESYGLRSLYRLHPHVFSPNFTSISSIKWRKARAVTCWCRFLCRIMTLQFQGRGDALSPKGSSMFSSLDGRLSANAKISRMESFISNPHRVSLMNMNANESGVRLLRLQRLSLGVFLLFFFCFPSCFQNQCRG